MVTSGRHFHLNVVANDKSFCIRGVYFNSVVGVRNQLKSDLLPIVGLNRFQ